jgi:hypothetical protein
MKRCDKERYLYLVAGFDDAADNTLLDEHFTEYAQAIANGILKMVNLK